MGETVPLLSIVYSLNDTLSLGEAKGEWDVSWWGVRGGRGEGGRGMREGWKGV